MDCNTGMRRDATDAGERPPSRGSRSAPFRAKYARSCLVVGRGTPLVSESRRARCSTIWWDRTRS